MRRVKRRLVIGVQKYLLNPPIRLSLRFGFALPGYAHDSGPLGDEVRHSLVDDLRGSDRV